MDLLFVISIIYLLSIKTILYLKVLQMREPHQKVEDLGLVSSFDGGLSDD